LVDIDKDGDVQTTLIPFQPVRKVRRVQGRFEDLLATAAAEPSEDFSQLILTDDRGLLDPMPRIREFYPNALDLRFVSQERELTAEDLSRALETKSPIEMIRTFLEDIRETSPDDDEVSYVEEKLNELANQEASQ
ncbi:MAG: exonuclease SbcCD subunit D C-terminal domain-containing protein, partial [Pseudomonadales bacterium]